MFEDSVFVTGHRPSELGGWNEENDVARDVKKWLFQAIQRAYTKGKRIFISGGACGVDIWFGEAVLALKDKHPDIRLIMAIPYATQADRWAKFNQLRWRRLVQDCDEMHVIYDDPPAESPTFEYAKRLNGRNHWMVDRGEVGIAVCLSTKTSGGTINCLRTALQQNRSVLVYHPDTKTERWQS
ncbi:MAG: DUF1273 family protein [Thermoplasmata archaeon]|nr:DUF1273 family protein [Thermoplasmata archaeon]